MADHRKNLDQLRAEWCGCTACELGQRRSEVDGGFVFGEGMGGGIMFIGEGPGHIEEQYGRPFVGPSGKLLRKVINLLGLHDYYLTNCVTCRSCAQAYDGGGNPIYRKSRQGGSYPLIRDEPPTPAQIARCLPRLQEEIYLVDPCIIIALGAAAAQTLRGRHVSILVEHGQTETITIPGALQVAVLTEKKKAWARRLKGEWTLPTTTHSVQYLMMPVLHPAYALRRQADQSKGNALECFVADIKKAVQVYDRYNAEVFGTSYAERDVQVEDLQEEEP